VNAFAVAAPRLHDQGCNVIPTREKRPLVSWSHWQEVRQTLGELRDLVQRYPDADPALVLGPVSGVVDLDVDNPAAAKAAIRQCGLPLPVTACFRSPRGPHRLYRHDAPIPTRRRILPGVDLLGRGSIAVLPPAAGRHWLLGLEHLTALPAPWVALVAVFPTTPDRLEQAKEASSVYPQLASSGGAKKDLFRDWRVVQRVMAVIGIGGARLGQGFRCVLPGHSEERPSAALFRDRSGCVVYHDFHERSGWQYFTLSEVYAARVSGRVRKLRGPESAVWAVRLLHAAGVIPLPEVTLVRPLLPPDASGTVVQVAEGFDLLRRCRALHDGDAPAPFTWRFASRWCAVGQGKAGAAIRYLHDTSLLHRAGTWGKMTLFNVCSDV
jgi:bifunctional DNA primase/polymerase-like protein